MSTKDKFLVKDNQQHFATDTQIGSRYSNLNLNQSFKTSILIPVQSLSKLDNNKNDDSTVNDKNGEKGNLQSWNKSSDLSLNALKMNDEIEKNKAKNYLKKYGPSNISNKSTLFLHITGSDSFIVKNNVGEKFEPIKREKQIFAASTFFIQNPFEFSRQQSDKMPEPGIFKFTASQHLLNPNATSKNDRQQIVNILQQQQQPPKPPPQPSAAVLQRHQLNPLRNYDTYEYQLQSCAAFNKRLISQRRRPYPFFDQQTGIAQRPNTDYVRDISDRCPTRNSGEVYRYTAQKWKSNSKVSFDSVEFKYILGTDPALKAAVDHLMNPEQSSIPRPTEASNNSSITTPKFTGGRTNIERVEVEDFEQDDGERDHTDEEYWGEKKPKRKRNAPYKAQSGKRGSGVANLALGPDGTDPRKHVCPECGARYKSRPGLVYHRKHAHENH